MRQLNKIFNCWIATLELLKNKKKRMWLQLNWINLTYWKSINRDPPTSLAQLWTQIGEGLGKCLSFGWKTKRLDWPMCHHIISYLDFIYFYLIFVFKIYYHIGNIFKKTIYIKIHNFLYSINKYLVHLIWTQKKNSFYNKIVIILSFV